MCHCRSPSVSRRSHGLYSMGYLYQQNFCSSLHLKICREPVIIMTRVCILGVLRKNFKVSISKRRCCGIFYFEFFFDSRNGNIRFSSFNYRENLMHVYVPRRCMCPESVTTYGVEKAVLMKWIARYMVSILNAMRASHKVGFSRRCRLEVVSKRVKSWDFPVPPERPFF